MHPGEQREHNSVITGINYLDFCLIDKCNLFRNNVYKAAVGGLGIQVGLTNMSSFVSEGSKSAPCGNAPQQSSRHERVSRGCLRLHRLQPIGSAAAIPDKKPCQAPGLLETASCF